MSDLTSTEVAALEQLGWRFNLTSALKFPANTEEVIGREGDATWVADLAAVQQGPPAALGMPAAAFAGQFSGSPKQKA